MDYPGKVITKNQVTPTQTSATGVWTLDDAAAATRNNNWPVAGVPNPISKSLRFNNADSAYLNRTPASATNRKTWTWSGWVKRSDVALVSAMFSAFNNSTGATDVGTAIRFLTTTIDIFDFTNSTYNFQIETTQVFRDPSAWYHIVVAFDTTQATASNRIKIYVNGVQVTAFTTATYPNQNTDWGINNTVTHALGCLGVDNSPQQYLGGYMTEVNFIDGQALTPSSFGMTDPVTGVWEPLKYSGTYGTNGFYLNFKDATSTTTLGYDYSGNANNWTTNNFSVTAGSGNDSLTDVPTPWIVYNTTGDVGGVVRGNYATLNPLASVSSPPTFANGNLEATGPASGVGVCQTTAAATSGKFYAEVTVTRTSDRLDLGIMGSGVSMTTTNYLGTDTNTIAYLTSTGVIRKDNTNNQTGLATCTTGDVVGMTVDMDTGSIQFYKNNATVGTAVSFTPSSYVAFLFAQTTSNNTSKGTWNFGQRPFAYTPPSGFLSLCTTNLPASTVLKGSEYFDVLLYAGNNASPRSLTGLSFAPDFGWLKRRTAAADHQLFDIVRGVSSTAGILKSNTTDAESSSLLGLGQASALTSDGFTVIQGGTGITNVNSTGDNYVSWLWKANGAGVSNTAGSITSTVSANTTSGFSIVTFTDPNNSSNYTVGHGLGVTPSMIIQKERGTTGSWLVWHSAATTTVNQYLLLNSTGATGTLTNVWGAAVPTSTVFGLKSGTSVDLGDTVVAYCFAAISGFSAFGSYTGNGSADGPFVYLGFRPRFVMWKNTTTAGYNWEIIDTARDTYNVMLNVLGPNSSAAESAFAGPPYLDAVSNGFKIRTGSASSGYQNINNNNDTYIYAAFAENPFKNALAR